MSRTRKTMQRVPGQHVPRYVISCHGTLTQDSLVVPPRHWFVFMDMPGAALSTRVADAITCKTSSTERLIAEAVAGKFGPESYVKLYSPGDLMPDDRLIFKSTDFFTGIFRTPIPSLTAVFGELKKSNKRIAVEAMNGRSIVDVRGFVGRMSHLIDERLRDVPGVFICSYCRSSRNPSAVRRAWNLNDVNYEAENALRNDAKALMNNPDEYENEMTRKRRGQKSHVLSKRFKSAVLAIDRKTYDESDDVESLIAKAIIRSGRLPTLSSGVWNRTGRLTFSEKNVP